MKTRGNNEPRTDRISWLMWVILILLAVPVAARGQFDFAGTITITGYTGPGGAVTIPSTINGLTVTRIGFRAFAGQTNVTSVTIPDSVSDIDDGAFSDCTALIDITISTRVTNIASETFAGCTSLRSISIPEAVTNIGPGAFSYCRSLQAVTIPDSVRSIGDSAFAGCVVLTSAAIGKGVTSIGPYAFFGCGGLSILTIPDSVTNIDRQAFSFCSGLGSLSIGKGLTSIGEAVFSGCSGLTSLTIPDNISTIRYSAFSGCPRLTSVTIGKGITSIESGAFSGGCPFCSSLGSVFFQGNAPSVAPTVFSGAENVTIYYLPGTTGWGPLFAERPTALWTLPYPIILNNGTNFGIHGSGFGFMISWATNIPVVVEARTNFANALWSSVGTNILTNGVSYFRDPEFGIYSKRFYRVRSQ